MSSAKHRRRWVVAAVVVLGVIAVLARAMRYGPTVMQGRAMEKFCSGLHGGITEAELKALAEREGYDTRQGSDDQGPYLQMDGDSTGHLYRCRARFKPDGTVASINFTANSSR